MRFINKQLQQAVCTGLVSIAVVSTASITQAVTVEQVPNPRKANATWVSDTAEILSPETEAQLNQMISQLEAKNGSEIAVVTVTETTSSTPKQFATNLFNSWKIGKAEQNNGVLFLISTKQKRVEIETGKGLQTILPSDRVNSIIQQEITPRFKQSDYNGGAIAGTTALVRSLDTSNQVAEPNVEESSINLPGILFFGGAALFAGLIYCAIKNKPRNSTPISKRRTKKSRYTSTHTGIGYDSDFDSDNSISYYSGSDSGSSYSSSDSGSSYSSSDSGSSYSSSDSGSSYSGGSDFGGGSSCGDGGGGSW